MSNTGQQIGRGVVDVYDDASKHVTQGVHAVEHGARYVSHKAEQAYDTTREAMIDGAHTAEHGVDAVEHAAHEAGERASGAWNTLTHPGSWFDHKPEAAKQAAPVQLDHPDHPEHAMYQQAFAGVSRIDALAGRAPNQQTAQVAASLVPAAVANGMTRIDEISLSRDGSRAFAVQNGRSPKLAYVQTDTAVNTSIAQSSVAWQEVTQQRAGQPQQASVPTAERGQKVQAYQQQIQDKLVQKQKGHPLTM